MLKLALGSAAGAQVAQIAADESTLTIGLNLLALAMLAVAAVPILRSRRKDAIIAELETTARVRGDRISDLETTLNGAQARANAADGEATKWHARYEEQAKYTAPEAFAAMAALISDSDQRSQERDQQIVGALERVVEQLDPDPAAARAAAPQDRLATSRPGRVHMTIAWLRASLALWHRREPRRKKLHTRAQRDLVQARDRGADAATIARLTVRRDLRSRQLREARDRIALREGQLAERRKLKPRLITAAQLGLRFQDLWGPKGPLDSIAGHYDAGTKVNSDTELIARARSIHRYHTDIEYGGASYEALVAGRTIVLLNPMDRKSAAVAGQNTGLASICVPGTTGDVMDEETRQTVQWLIANWHKLVIPKRHRLPRGARTVVRLPHKEFPGQSTLCPGSYVTGYRRAWA